MYNNVWRETLNINMLKYILSVYSLCCINVLIQLMQLFNFLHIQLPFYLYSQLELSIADFTSLMNPHKRLVSTDSLSADHLSTFPLPALHHDVCKTLPGSR